MKSFLFLCFLCIISFFFCLCFCLKKKKKIESKNSNEKKYLPLFVSLYLFLVLFRLSFEEFERKNCFLILNLSFKKSCHSHTQKTKKRVLS